jgi:UDP-N-acetylmuramate dehydrogenase
MTLSENISLQPFNTFHIDVKASTLATFANVSELSEIITRFPKGARMVLGGGSNILLTKDFDGLILKNEIKGIDKVKEDDDFFYVRSGAGESWHTLVMHCIEQGYAGLENLSLIPGNVGASPMQNIGAYGVELKDVFHELRAWHLREKCNYTFSAKDCEFGYRESVFKKKYKNEFVILDVTFRLRKKPVFHTSYGAIEQELAAMGVTELSIKAISDAVVHIRSSKLPDPRLVGNAGSFFKNPSVSAAFYENLKQDFPNIIAFENPDKTMKLAAGWLIEQCGWKGFRRGDAGCHVNQALVLVNYGNATGAEIFQLSEDIIESVKNKFSLSLEREVNIF